MSAAEESMTISSVLLRGASEAAAAAHRLLQQEEMFDDNSTTENEQGEFNPNVFWGVNGFILCLFIVACCLCCKSDLLTQLYDRRHAAAASDRAYQRRVLERMQEEQQAKLESPEKRQRKLLASFKRHGVQMTVAPEDILQDGDATQEELEQAKSSEEESSGYTPPETSSNPAEESTHHEHGHIRLPTGGLVPNCCAVCLGDYEVGDSLIWSSNNSCNHAFHQECIVEWLLKQNNRQTPCPLCRNEFTDLEEQRQEDKIKWKAGPTFDISAVRL